MLAGAHHVETYSAEPCARLFTVAYAGIGGHWAYTVSGTRHSDTIPTVPGHSVSCATCRYLSVPCFGFAEYVCMFFDSDVSATEVWFWGRRRLWVWTDLLKMHHSFLTFCTCFGELHGLS